MLQVSYNNLKPIQLSRCGAMFNALTSKEHVVMCKELLYGHYHSSLDNRVFKVVCGELFPS